MTDLRRKLISNARFLAVAVLLCAMAYVTWHTQQDVRKANDDREALRARVVRLEVELAKKDAEIRRLTALLVKNGIDPRPTPTATRTPSTARGTTKPGARSVASPTPKPRSTPSTRPAPSPRPTRTPSPSPSPTATALQICLPAPVVLCVPPDAA